MSDASGFISAARSVDSVWEDRETNQQRPWLVGTPDELIGLLQPERVAEAMESGHGSEPIGSLVDVPFHHAHPDQAIDVVLERLADSGGLLPIVSREEIRRVEGVITSDDLSKLVRRKRRTAPLS